MTDRAAAARPGCAGSPGAASAAYTSCRAVIGRHGDRGLPQRAPGLSRCTCAASAACPPLVKAPRAHRLWVSLIDGSGPGITAGYICGKRSAYLCAIAAWRVDSFAFFSIHRARIALSQVKALLRARPGNTIPSISPMCAQARRRFTQVIHMVVHSKACNTFSCRAGRQRVSVPVLARGGRHAGRGSGLGLDDIAHDGGHRMLAAHPAGQAARVTQAPACCHAHRDPAGRASPIRSSCPGSVAASAGPPPARPRPRAGAGGAGPHRRPGSAADHRPATADAGALAPGGVPARDGAAPSLAGSHSGGPARVCCRRGGSRAHCLRPGAAAREPRPCSAGPPIIAAGIPAVAGVPALARRSCRAESGTAPPCMRWRGRARPRRAGWPVAWSSPRAARRPPGPGTRARGRSPGSSRVPGVAPGWCPFPAVKAFLLPPRAPRKALRPAISCFSAIHGRIHRKQAVIRISQRLSTGLLTACPQATGCKPENT